MLSKLDLAREVQKARRSCGQKNEKMQCEGVVKLTRYRQENVQVHQQGETLETSCDVGRKEMVKGRWPARGLSRGTLLKRSKSRISTKGKRHMYIQDLTAQIFDFQRWRETENERE